MEKESIFNMKNMGRESIGSTKEAGGSVSSEFFELKNIIDKTMMEIIQIKMELGTGGLFRALKTKNFEVDDPLAKNRDPEKSFPPELKKIIQQSVELFEESLVELNDRREQLEKILLEYQLRARELMTGSSEHKLGEISKN